MNTLERNRWTEAWRAFGRSIPKPRAILAHMHPDADVPVVQMSLDASLSFDEHVALGAVLAPLRHEGVLVLGSSDIVHNLRVMDWGSPDGAYPWAQEFAAAARELLASDPSRLGSLVSHPHYRLAVPTAGHFVPALYLAGLADAAGSSAEVLIEGSAFGSISMTSYVVR